jgi:hypothetical protein
MKCHPRFGRSAIARFPPCAIRRPSQIPAVGFRLGARGGKGVGLGLGREPLLASALAGRAAGWARSCTALLWSE